MFVDATTLQDLDAVPLPDARGTTLWSLIDRTRTRAGREALRRRLLHPARHAADILELQRAHQAVGREPESAAYRRVLDAAAADEVERYLGVTWQLPHDMPSMARARKWYRQYVQDVDRGRTFVASLLEAAGELSGRARASDAAMLRAIGDAIAAAMEAAAVAELRRLAVRRTPASRAAFDQLARGHAKAGLTRVIESIGELEALWSVGAATAEHGWAYPRPSLQWRFTGLVHPFLGRDSVANDLCVDPGIRVCFVTGPNMAGKSTFLKAVALAVLLAHMGAGVPAASMDFVPVGALFSSMRVADSVCAGESFYLAEVRRVGALASALDLHGSAVAIIDEPFRGTNVHDAAEATLAVATRLAAHPAALVFIASHVAEAARALAHHPNVALLAFAADLVGDRPSFDFRLRHGVSEQRLGMTLLRQEGVLERLERSAAPAAPILPLTS